MSTKPLSPTEVVAYRKSAVPDFVVQSWNDCIAEKWDGQQAKVFLADLGSAICAASPLPLEWSDLIDKDYLHLDSLFRAEGWDVKYRRSAYYESFRPCFVFTPAQKA